MLTLLIMLSIENLAYTAHCIFDLHIFPRCTGELFSDAERLGHEANAQANRSLGNLPSKCEGHAGTACTRSEQHVPSPHDRPAFDGRDAPRSGVVRERAARGKTRRAERVPISTRWSLGRSNGPPRLPAFERPRPADALAIADECPSVRAVSPLVGAQAQVVGGNVNWKPSQMQGVGADYMEVRNWKLAAGEFLSERDIASANKVCVIGHTLLIKLEFYLFGFK